MQLVVKADYLLKIHILSYASTPHRKYDGFCCGGQDATGCTEHCNNMFTFCVRPTGFDRESDTCPTGRRMVTGPISNDNMEFESGRELSVGVSNPLVFTGERWPVSEFNQAMSWSY